MKRRTHQVATLLLAMSFAIAPVAARAGDIDEAKTSGQVGERFDGYLGVVDEAAPTNVKALVEDVNQQRREAYEKVAAKNKVSVDKIGRVAGKKLIERTKGGQFVLPKPADDWEQQDWEQKDWEQQDWEQKLKAK